MSSAVYCFWRGIEGRKSLDTQNRVPKEQAKYLLDNHMQNVYLGLALDSCRWGSPVTVLWDMDVRGMISFIQNWMQQNEGHVKELLHERKLEEIYTKFELPYLDKECEGHKRKLEINGRVYCGEYEVKEMNLKEIIFSEDPYVQIKLKDFFHKNPTLFTLLKRTHEEYVSYECDSSCKVDCESDHGGDFKEISEPFDWFSRRFIPEDSSGYLEDLEIDFNEQLGYYWEQVYEKELAKLKEEVPTTAIEPCKGLISDKGKILSLETILSRLNIHPEERYYYCQTGYNDCLKNKKDPVCFGHTEKTNKTVFTCDGWDIAFYVQNWMEQVPDGKAPLFEIEEEKKFRKEFPKHIPEYCD